MTKNFNKLLKHFLHKMTEANEHLNTPEMDKADIDTTSFAQELVDALRARGVFKTSEKYINFNDFIQTEEKDGQVECTMEWFGFKGEYTVTIKKTNETFVVSVDCNDKRIDAPSSNQNSPWESYITELVEYIVKQEKEAEEAHDTPEQTDDMGAIEPVSAQPSALPGAPPPPANPPTQLPQ